MECYSNLIGAGSAPIRSLYGAAAVWLTVAGLVASILMFTGSDAFADPPPTEPFLRLEAGGHAGEIELIRTDAKVERVLTVGDDMTARLWNAQTGDLLRIIRPPVDFNKPGTLLNIQGAAISPDGHTIAVGGGSLGWEDFGPEVSIFLYDADTGVLIRRFKVSASPNSRPNSGEPGYVRSLAFSPDGETLAAGFSEDGLKLFDISDGRLLGQDQTCNDVSSLSYRPDGQALVVGCYGGVVAYRTDGGLRRVADAGDFNKALVSVDFSPDGGAVAAADGRSVQILDAASLSIKWRWSSSRGFGPGGEYIGSARWSTGGRLVVGIGDRGDGPYASTFRIFSSSGQEVGHGNLSTSFPTDAAGSPKGDTFYATEAGEWGVITAAAILPLGRSHVLDFRHPSGSTDTLNLSSGGWSVSFGAGKTGDVAFSIRDRHFTSPAADSLFRPRGHTDKIFIVDDFQRNLVLLNGHPLSIPVFSTAEPFPFCVAVSESSSSFVLCARGEIIYYDSRGQILWTHRAPGNECRAANISRDERLVVLGCRDGSIRWYRTSDGAELLSLFIKANRRSWVLWTPSGYYDASADGEDLIGWQVNRDADHAADFYPVSRFADTMRRPDIVNAVVTTLDEGEAIVMANAASGLRQAPITQSVVSRLLPPVLDLVSAPVLFDSDRVTIAYRVREPDGAPMIGDPRVKVNGEWQPRSREAVRDDGGQRTLTVTGLPPRDSTVELYAENRNATSTALVVPLKWGGAAVLTSGVQGEAASHKPRLFILAVGVSQYQKPDLNLTFADHDAEAFTAAMQAQQGKEYALVTIKLLVNREANQAGVVAGLHWLESQVSGDDVGILFIAGHGFETPNQSYFFAPTDFDPARPRETGVDYKTIREALVHFAGAGNRAVFLIDTCHAGGAVGSDLGSSNGETLANELGRSENAVVVLTAAEGNQLSYEDAQWGDGAFTKAILEAIVDAKADPEQSGIITMLDLGRYVSKRVPVLTEQKQDPLLIMPAGGVPDFPVAAR